MGSAIAERLSPYNQVTLYDRNPSKTEILADKGFGKAAQNLSEALAASQLIILAIKPQSLAGSAAALQQALTSDHTVVSILSGTSLQQLSEHFPECRCVRMMPNIPLLCGEGSIGMSCKESDRETLGQELDALFEPLGKIFWLPESKFDAFTALAGSGPAFVFALTEAIVDAGIAMGFPAKEAQTIAYQMLRGSVELMESGAKHPGELKWLVTSPGGTTIAGIEAFEEHGVRNGLLKTFLATFRRTVEMR